GDTWRHACSDWAMPSFNPRPAVRPGDTPHMQPVDCSVQSHKFPRTCFAPQSGGDVLWWLISSAY
ncbi:MAG: hypothetical protein WA108_06005, partial [Thiobacillus sp.]